MPSIDRCGYAGKWEDLIKKYELVAISREIIALKEACQ